MLSVSFLGINGSLVDRDGGNTSLLFRSPDLKTLVDVSGNIAEAVDADIDSVIITHEHIDHVYGFVSLLHQLWLSGRERKLSVYCHEKVIPLLEGLVTLFSLREKRNFFPLTIEKAEDFRKGGTEVSFFPTDHTSSSFGLVMTWEGEKIIYTSDTRPIKEFGSDWSEPDILIHEASGIKRDEETLIRKGHSSAYDAAEAATSLRAKSLLLCHLPKGEEKKKEILEEAKMGFENSSLPSLLTLYTVEK